MANSDWLGLAGKRVLQIGAGGFGGAIAKGFIDEGAHVYVVDQQEISPLLHSGDSSVLCYEARKIASKDDCDSVVKNALGVLGGIDIFVYAIGVNNRVPITEISVEDYRRIQLINTEICLWTAQALFPHIKNSGGKLVFFSSVSAFLAHPHHGAYAASKGAITQLLKVMAIEWAEYGICVNAVAPGYAITPLTQKHLEQGNHYEELVSKVPMGRLASIDDVVGPVLFLSSERSAYITGHTIVIDGGRMLD
jgi:NAD(P)-dependent dehydrogenase (short-subunit alcohol dehydrogenase family)